MADDRKAVVLHIGSGNIQAGFEADDVPSYVSPSVVGRLTENLLSDVMVGISMRESYVGDEAQDLRSLLALSYPISRGLVTNWEDMEKLLHHTFWKGLDVHPAEHPCFLSEVLQNPMSQRTTMFQTLFEAFDVPFAYLYPSPVLGMYASGRTTGIVVECGEGVTSVLPIFEGFAIKGAARRLDLGGCDVTTQLQKLLRKNCGLSLETSSAEFEIVRIVKETHGFVHEDFRDIEETLSQASPGKSNEIRQKYEIEAYLPDGRTFNIGTERFECAEVLFQPSLAGKQVPGIAQLVCNSMNACPLDARPNFVNNVILAGGSTLFRGFKDRLEKDLANLLPSSTYPKIIAAPERRYSVWIGGSILTSLSSFRKKWIRKGDFEELGPHGLKRLLPDCS